MKVQVTAKSVRESYAHIIQIGYCDAQTLLRCAPPHFYTCGVYGWNANVHDVGGGVAIVTGYRPFGEIKPSYKLVRAYEDRAREEGASPELLAEFIQAALNE